MIQSYTPTIIPRWYQSESSDAGSRHLMSPKYNGGGLIVLPTGSGKSVVLASIVSKLDGPALIFQPSREILKQNFEKLMHYGFRPAVYSASLGKKQISGAVTLATIGSVVKRAEDFAHVRYVLIDECHAVSPGAGMYAEFLKRLPNARLLGTTATPFRLSSTMQGSILKFLTRTRPREHARALGYRPSVGYPTSPAVSILDDGSKEQKRPVYVD